MGRGKDERLTSTFDLISSVSFNLSTAVLISSTSTSRAKSSGSSSSEVGGSVGVATTLGDVISNAARRGVRSALSMAHV